MDWITNQILMSAAGKRLNLSRCNKVKIHFSALEKSSS